MQSRIDTFAETLAEASAAIAAADPVMRDVVAAIGPCLLLPEWRQSPFESLVRAVAHQQLQGKAAAAILARFVALFPPPFPTADAILAADEDSLRAAGFSRSKVAAIRDIASKMLVGIVPDRAGAEAMEDALLIERLITIRGVGRWTVEMLLIFTLGRLDIFPADDFGVRAGIRLAYRLDTAPPPREASAMGDRFRPYRSVAAWYLWRVAGSPGRKPVRPAIERPDADHG